MHDLIIITAPEWQQNANDVFAYCRANVDSGLVWTGTWPKRGHLNLKCWIRDVRACVRARARVMSPKLSTENARNFWKEKREKMCYALWHFIRNDWTASSSANALVVCQVHIKLFLSLHHSRASSAITTPTANSEIMRTNASNNKQNSVQRIQSA